MLFSPPNEFGKLIFYKLVGYSFALHCMILLLLLGMESWLGMRPMVISLKKPGRVCLGSRRIKALSDSMSHNTASNRNGSHSQQEHVGEQAEQKVATPQVAEPKKPVAPKKFKHQEKKPVPHTSKTIPARPVLKKVPERKIPDKKIDKKKEPLKIEKVKESKAVSADLATQKILQQEPSKKETVVKKDKHKEHEATVVKDSPVTKLKPDEKKHVASTQTTPMSNASSVRNDAGLQDQQYGDQNVDYEEVCAADAACSEDTIQKEFGTHFTIPEGFEEYDSFTISFDIKEGKVANVSPHTQGALVVYTAVKDALLKSTMPIRSRKNIIWIIT